MPPVVESVTRFSRFRAVLFAVVIGAAFCFATTQPASAGPLGSVPYHHGFHVASSPQSGVNDMMAGSVGGDTIRIHVYWNEYQTGPSTYSQTWLDSVVNRVQGARNNSSNSNIKALIQFDLPGAAIPWMQTAGYGLSTISSSAPYRRYYPSTAAGMDAYGHAMAGALKYLSDAGVADFIETPNEPNLTNGPSDPVPPANIGQMGGYAVTWGGLLGVPQNPNTGPAILVGSISADAGTGNSYGSLTPANYFSAVQTAVDSKLNDLWPIAWANAFKPLWRPSLHAYPSNGTQEAGACTVVNPTQGWRQDTRGDITGSNAWSTVLSKMSAVVGTFTNSKKWWLTETGMSSFKKAPNGETLQECLDRRRAGGGTYGKNQQAAFYSDFRTWMNYFKANSGYPWSGFEGVTFFHPVDSSSESGQFAGYGVHIPVGAPGCPHPYPCRKTAAYTFANYYGDPVP